MWRTEKPLILGRNDSASLLPNNLTAGPSHIAYCHLGEAKIIQNETSTVSVVPSHSSPEQVMQVKIMEIDEDEVLVSLSTKGAEFWKLMVDGSSPVLISTIGLDQLVHSDNGYPFVRGVALIESSNSPTGDNIVCIGCSSGDVVILSNIRRGLVPQVIRRFSGHSDSAVVDVVVVDYKALIVAADDQGMLRIFDIFKDKPDEEYCFFRPPNLNHSLVPVDEFTPEPPQSCPCTSLAARGTTLLSAYANGSVRIIRVDLKEVIAELSAHSRSIGALCFHPRLPVFATVGEDTFLHIWSLPDSEAKGSAEVELIFSNRADDALLCGVAFTDDGDRMVASAYDETAILTWKWVVVESGLLRIVSYLKY